MSLVSVPSPDALTTAYGRFYVGAEKIKELYLHRQRMAGLDLLRMRHVQAVMDGEIVLPLPSQVGPSEQAAVANLALQGMGQLARRTASLLPTVHFPTIRPGIKRSANDARNRRRITMSWHKENQFQRLLGKRARFFLAYATAPVVIEPNAEKRIPQWRVLNPLHTFPSENDYDELTPRDCIHDMEHSYAWLKDHYPEQVKAASKPPGWDYDNDLLNNEVMFTVLQYWSKTENSLVLLGHGRPEGWFGDDLPATDGNAIYLETVPNLTGMCQVVTPGSINLSKPQGHFDQIIGMYQMQAALMAMTYVAQQRAIWPREWLVARVGETPQIKQIPDPPAGIPGVLEGGELDHQTLDPSFRALELQDRLEHAQRQTAGLPAEFGGMSATNIRTGKRGSQVMSSTIDFTIQEAQNILAESVYEENRRAIAIDRHYFPSRKTYLIVTRSFSGKVLYTPGELWTTDKHVVDYPLAGTDMQNLTIEGGQRVAMGTLSRQTFMEMDPAVADAEAEIQRIQREGIATAFLSSIQNLAAMPEGPYQPVDLARLDQLVAEGMELYEAVIKLQKEVQERQATQAPAPTDPAAQPGLSLPGEGVEQPGAIPEPTPDMNTMAQLLGQMGTVQTAQRFRQ